MVQFVGLYANTVGNGLRAVPRVLERHGVRSLQNRATEVLPRLEPCRKTSHFRPRDV